MRRAVLLLVCASSVGCGSDDGSGSDSSSAAQTVTCEWLMGDNCWRTSVNAFAQCASDQRGTFDAERKVCTTPDGGVIRFATSVPHDVDFDYLWDFTIESQGMSCGTYKALPNDSGASLSTPGGEVRSESGGSGQVFVCPDGSRFTLPIDQAFSCLFSLPGIAWSEAAALSVSLTGADDGQLFSCGDPE